MRINIIVPIYNNKLHIEKCILSVLNQSYNNKRLILVNDGSTDGSDEICASFADKYNNVVFINNSINSGVSHARNLGIEYVLNNQSFDREMIMFLDSDDFYTGDCLTDYAKLANQTETCIVTNSIEYVNGKEFRYTAIENIDEVLATDALVLFADDCFPVSTCIYLYDSKLFENVRFNEQLVYFEDFDVNLRILLDLGDNDYAKSTKILVLHKPYYNYMDSNKRCFKFEYLGIFEYIDSYYSSSIISEDIYSKLYRTLIIHELCALMLDVSVDNEIFKQTCKKFKYLARKILKYKKYYSKSFNRILLISISPWLYVKLLRWKNYSEFKRKKNINN